MCERHDYQLYAQLYISCACNSHASSVRSLPPAHGPSGYVCHHCYRRHVESSYHNLVSWIQDGLVCSFAYFGGVNLQLIISMACPGYGQP